MKNYQVRLSDEVHATIKEIATAQNMSIADVIRESLEMYAVAVFYAMEGKQLFWEDRQKGERAEVLIPGLTMRGLRDRVKDQREPVAP